MGSVVSSVTGGVFGSGSQAGLFGTGQFHADPYSIDRSAFDPNDDEKALVKVLQDQMAGKGPSVAQLQMQQGLDSAMKNAQAMAASSRGINPALAQRLAQQQQAGIAQQGAAQGAQLRAAEQQQAQGNLMNQLSSLRQSRQNREALASGNANAAMGVNAQAYEGAAGRRQNMLSGIGSGIMAMAGFSKGGQVPGYAEGGEVNPFFEAYLNKINEVPELKIAEPKSLNEEGKSFGKYLGSKFGDSGADLTHSFGDGMATLHSMPLAIGGKVPGRAEVKGDSQQNDKVPAMLSPGEIVVPRTVVQEGPDAAKRFVAAILREQGMKL